MSELSAQFSQVMQPFFWAMAFVFLIISWSVYKPFQVDNSSEHSDFLPFLGGLFSALGCVFLVLVAYWGRFALTLVSLFNLATFITIAFLLQAWCQALTRGFVLKVAAMCGGFVVVLAFAFQLSNPVLRMSLQVVFYIAMVAWISRSLRQLSQAEQLKQLGMTKIIVFLLNVLIVIWVAINLLLRDWDVVVLGPDVAEPYLSFVCRFFWIALMLALQFNINSLAMERLAHKNAIVENEKLKVEQANQALSLTLEQKNETLRLLSIAARQYNFPLMMSSLAHELNQPLFAIHLYSDHMASDWDVMNDDDRAQVADGLVECSVAASEVVADYKKMFDQFNEEKKQIDLGDMCQSVTRAMSSEFQRKNIDLSLKLLPAVELVADPMQLETALAHALRYFTNQRQPDLVSLMLKLELKRQTGFVQVLISANLPLLDSTALKDAFKRNVSMEQDALKPSSLWLCRSIWEHWGGGVELKSTPEGLALYLNFPWNEQA